jgi:peptidoglycan/LPS O-acetylase OafA/YrhL
MATAEVLCDREIGSVAAQRFYRPELDALRFFAFLAVYLCHSIPNNAAVADSQAHSFWLQFLVAIKDAGNFGVCLFFMLSAFLITELLRREQERLGRIHVGAFYARRILRIWPLYFGTVVAYFFAGRYFPAMRIETGRILAYFLLAGNWYIALHPWIQTPLRSLWSISIEEQFYLLWPIVAACGGMRALALASLVIVPVSFLTIFVISADRAYAYNTVWLNSFTQFQFLAWGALLALVLHGGIPKINSALRSAVALAGIALWLVSAHLAQIKRPGAAVSQWQFCAGYLLVAAGCLLLLVSVYGASGRWLPGWMVRLGKISFGLYVFHETAFLLVDEAQKHAALFVPHLAFWANQHTAMTLAINKIFALVVTILLAAFSYRFWESPFLRLKRRVTWIQSRGI